MSEKSTQEIQELLAEPFETIKWKPQVTKKKDGSKYIDQSGQQIAGCTAHIDARDVMNRLDEVVGVLGWSDSYQVISSKNVECTLTVLGVSKSDVGEVNADGFADPIKTAYSDALKRAAVKFGIGRHLYDMEMEWKPFDGYRIIERTIPKHTPVKKPSDNGNNDTDIRAWLDEKITNGSVQLGIVADALCMTKLYNDREHVRNALAGDDFKAMRDDGLEVDFRKKVSKKGAFIIFDTAIARKAESA